MNYDSSVENDRTAAVTVLTLPVNRKSISLENKCLKKNSGVTEPINESNYLQRKKKKKYHSPKLKNTLQQDLASKNERIRDVTELRSSELSLPENRKSITSDEKSLENYYTVSEITTESNYFKNRGKKKHPDSSRTESEIHYDSVLEKIRNWEITKIKGSELSLPSNGKSISSEIKLPGSNSGVTETSGESNYLSKRKKKHHHSPGLGNMLHDESSLLEKNRNQKTVEMCSSALGSLVNGKYISSENYELKENNEVSEIVTGPRYFKQGAKNHRDSSRLKNMTRYNSSLENDTSSEVIVISSSESISPISRKCISSENKLLKKNSEGSKTVNESNYLKKRKRKKYCDFTNLENVKHDSSPGKERNSEVIEICSSKLTSQSVSSENNVVKNSISPSKKQRKLQRNNSLTNKCEDTTPTLTNSKREQRYTNHSTSQIIEYVDTNCLLKKSGATSSPEKKKRKMAEINCESCGLKRKQKMQKQANQNAVDNCVVEQTPSLEAPSSKRVGNGERKKKYQHAIQDESSISHDDANTDLHTSRRDPSPFTVTSQILEKNKLVQHGEEDTSIPVCKVLTPLPHKIPKEQNTRTVQNECDISGSINSELFQNSSKFTRLPIRETGTQKEINSECPKLTSKEKKKRRGTTSNVIFYPELGSQPLLHKRKKKNEHRSKNTSHDSCNENFISDFGSSESESCVKFIGTTQKENDAQFKNFMVKSRENKRTNNFTICNASENSPSSVLSSTSCDEIGKPVFTNSNILNVDSDDESLFDFVGNERSSFTDLLTFYANKIGDKKEECDKIWNDAVTAELEGSALQNCLEVDVNIRHDIPVLHSLDCSVCTVPSKEEREHLASVGMKEIPFDKSEDAIIMNNWNNLCEDNDVSSSVLRQNIIKRGYKRTKKSIVQYLGNGLPHRALYQIYHRFILLSASKKGPFTDEEDYILLKAVKSHVKEKYSILSSVLQRSRNAIYKRHQRLLALARDPTGSYERIKSKWDITFASQVVKLLMRISGASSIEDFRDITMSADVWRQMENELKTPHWKLHQFWTCKLHVQLFAKTPVCEKQVQKKIVKWLHQKNYSTEKEIEWSQSRHLLSGSTSPFMWLQFRLVKYKFQFKSFKGLKAFIEAVYSQRKDFDGASRYLTRYKVNEDFSLSIVKDKEVEQV